MKTRNRITKTMAVAALAFGLVCAVGWLQPVQAQTTDGSVKFISYATVAIGQGERLRASVSNTQESGGTLTLSFSYYLAHGTNSASAVPFYETESMQVPRGEFRFSEVRREDLKTEGDPGTGRARVIVRITRIAAAGSDEEDFPGTLEVIQDGDQNGESVPLDTKYRMVILAAKRSKQLNAPISLNTDETLSYTFFNPNEEGSEPVRVQAYVYDSYGRLLSQTQPVELRPGESYTTTINGDDLRAASRNSMPLMLLSSGVAVALMDGSVRPVKLAVSMEVVNTRTGTSSGGSYYTGTVSVSGDGF